MIVCYRHGALAFLPSFVTLLVLGVGIMAASFMPFPDILIVSMLRGLLCRYRRTTRAFW